MIFALLFSTSWALECYERTYVDPGTIDVKLNKECSSAKHCVAFEGNNWDEGFSLRRGYCDEEIACEEMMRTSNNIHKVCKPSSISFQLDHNRNVNVNGNLCCCSGNLCNTIGLAGPEVPV